MTTPVNGTTNSLPSASENTGSTGAANSQKQLDTTYNQFIQLLLAQLKNQDPTNPVDTSQFTQQLAQLSQVQQSVNTNVNLEKLITASQNTQISNSVSYIGKTVDAIGNQSQLKNGRAEFAYNLPAAADSVKVTISDSAGHTVFNGDGSKTVGKNIVVWDGVNSTTGQTVSDGTYKISIKALDANGKDLEATTFTTGIVGSVNISNGVAQLSLGDGTLLVPLDSVVSIRGAAAVTQNS